MCAPAGPVQGGPGLGNLPSARPPPSHPAVSSGHVGSLFVAHVGPFLTNGGHFKVARCNHNLTANKSQLHHTCGIFTQNVKAQQGGFPVCPRAGCTPDPGLGACPSQVGFAE